MVKNLTAMQGTQVPLLGKEDPLRKEMQPTLVFLPGEFHKQGNLVGYSPWGPKEWDTTEQLTLSLFTDVKSLTCQVSSKPGHLLSSDDGTGKA